jgi:hypothetical protein
MKLKELMDMPEPKKVTLDDHTQKALWDLLHDRNEVVADVFGSEVRLTLLPRDNEELDDITSEIENDPELKQMLLESDQDIKAGRLYSTDEAIQYIREYHSKL